MKISDPLVLAGMALAGLGFYLFTRKSGTNNTAPVRSIGSQKPLLPFSGARNVSQTPSANPINSTNSNASAWAPAISGGLTGIGNIVTTWLGSKSKTTPPTQTLPSLPDYSNPSDYAATPESYGLNYDPYVGFTPMQTTPVDTTPAVDWGTSSFTPDFSVSSIITPDYSSVWA